LKLAIPQVASCRAQDLGEVLRNLETLSMVHPHADEERDSDIGFMGRTEVVIAQEIAERRLPHGGKISDRVDTGISRSY